MKVIKILCFILLLSISCGDKTIVIQQSDISNFPKDEQFTIYKKSFISYNKATKDEKFQRWIKMFSNCTYKIGGEYDCLTSILAYLKSWGANIITENIPSLVSRFEKLNALGQLKIKYPREAKEGDIIIFKPNRNNIYHCGIIYDIKNNFIIYMDVNIKLMGMGISDVELNSDKIKGIYEISFSLWLGDFLNKNL